MEQAAVRWKGVLKEGKGISQRTYTHDPGTWIMVWEWGSGWVEGSKRGKIGTTIMARQ